MSLTRHTALTAHKPLARGKGPTSSNPLAAACRTGKRRYRSQDKAVAAASRIALHQHSEKQRFARVYECRLCAGWHVTSQRARTAISPRDTGPNQRVTALVMARAGGRCERCGGTLHGPWGYSKQHRVPRALGGSSLPYINQASNLAVLCGSGTTGCHGEVESHRKQAEADGWVVRHPKNPAEQPVTLWDGRRVMFTDAGLYLPYEAGEAA